MTKRYQPQKWALLAALRQGEWVRLGQWGAVAVAETVKKPVTEASHALLPAVLFPDQGQGPIIGGSHLYVKGMSITPKDLTLDPLQAFQPERWAIAPCSDKEQHLLTAILSLVKEAGLLPFLLALPGQPDKGQISVDEAMLNDWADHQAAWAIAARATLPLAEGIAELVAFRPDDGGQEQVALLFGPPSELPIVRLHSQCLTGDVFGSQRCDCGQQLNGAMERLAQSKQGGVLLYLAQEGRGIGLVNKLRAYQLQDRGLDTLDANVRLGFGADERNYMAAAAMLKALGFPTIDLMSNNPEKAAALELHGIKVRKMVRHVFPPNRHNESYLATKARRFGHLF